MNLQGKDKMSSLHRSCLTHTSVKMGNNCRDWDGQASKIKINYQKELKTQKSNRYAWMKIEILVIQSERK